MPLRGFARTSACSETWNQEERERRARKGEGVDEDDECWRDELHKPASDAGTCNLSNRCAGLKVAISLDELFAGKQGGHKGIIRDLKENGQGVKAS